MERDQKGRAHRLVHYAKAIALDLPERYDLGETAGRITSVAEALEDLGSFDDLDGETKAAWSDVLFHNTVDLWALRSVAIRAAADLARIRG